jgi:hypothetical protein
MVRLRLKVQSVAVSEAIGDSHLNLGCIAKQMRSEQ